MTDTAKDFAKGYDKKLEVAKDRLKAMGIPEEEPGWLNRLSAAEFEDFTQRLLRDLVHVDMDCEFFRGKQYKSNLTGRPIAIDVSIEFEFAGVRYVTLIECKHLQRPVEVGVVRELKERMTEIGAHKGIIISTAGFQKGTLARARASGIALMHVMQSTTQELIFVATCCCVGFNPYYLGVFDVCPPTHSCSGPPTGPTGRMHLNYDLPHATMVLKELLQLQVGGERDKCT